MEEAEGRAAAGWPGWKHYAEISPSSPASQDPIENATGASEGFSEGATSVEKSQWLRETDLGAMRPAKLRNLRTFLAVS